MKKILKKLKPVLFLLTMSLISLGIVSVVKQFHTPMKSSIDQENVTEFSIVQGDNVVYAQDMQDSSTPLKVSESENYGFVLSASSTNNYNCPSNTYEITSQSVCSKTSSGAVDYKSGTRNGTMVSRKSKVILTAVKVPLELFSGIEVADSNRLITSEEPTLKAAGEQISETSVNVHMVPGTQVDTYKSYVEDKPVTTKYTLSFEQDNTITDKGEIGFDDEVPHECEQCDNPTNVNPDKTNKYSEFLLDSMYRTPGEKDTVTKQDVIEQCSETEDQFIHWDSDYDGCFMSIPQQFASLIKTIGDAIWNNCTTNPNASTECVLPENIVIVMSSMFGSDNDCIDSTCTNAYMATRNNSALAPTMTDSRKTYFTTDCLAVIEGRTHTVTCAWDMSHLFRERKVNEFDDLPDIESTPSDDDYRKFLLEKVQGNRPLAVPIQ